MNKSVFQEMLQRWCLEDADQEMGIEELKSDVEFLERELYHEYVVTAHGGHGPFGYRLARWIDGVDNEDDQKTLYTILRHLFFIGKWEQQAAYRTAYSKHIMRWLMKISNIDPFAENAHQVLQEQINATRFTEITDSFGIREFCLINGIEGEDVRYKWSGNINGWTPQAFRRDVLRENGDIRRVKKNLVLLEDFVGSGSQMKNAVELACSLGPDINVLLCPLFICPEGAQNAWTLHQQTDHLTFSPVLEFDQEFFINENFAVNEHEDFAKIRELLIRIHPKIQGEMEEYGPFGFRKTGGIIVPASNCPNNTIPAIHRKKEDEWEPLFLRTSRVNI